MISRDSTSTNVSIMKIRIYCSLCPIKKLVTSQVSVKKMDVLRTTRLGGSGELAFPNWRHKFVVRLLVLLEYEVCIRLDASAIPKFPHSQSL